MKGPRPTEAEVAALETEHVQGAEMKPGYCTECWEKLPCPMLRLAAWYRHLGRHEPDIREVS